MYKQFLVADLQNPPHCAAILPRSADEASRLLTVVGQRWTLVVEFPSAAPNLPRTSDLAFLACASAHDPCSAPNICRPSLGKHRSNMAMPVTSAKTNYLWSPDGKGNNLYCINTRLQTCLGIQCDRQKGKLDVPPANTPPTTPHLFIIRSGTVPASVHRADQSDPNQHKHTTHCCRIPFSQDH
jgi:hypothetical protein